MGTAIEYILYLTHTKNQMVTNHANKKRLIMFFLLCFINSGFKCALEKKFTPHHHEILDGQSITFSLLAKDPSTQQPQLCTSRPSHRPYNDRTGG